MVDRSRQAYIIKYDRKVIRRKLSLIYFSLRFPLLFRYKSRIRLNITRIRDEDYGEYQCISKNDVNTTTAVIYVNGMLIQLLKMLREENKKISLY